MTPPFGTSNLIDWDRPKTAAGEHWLSIRIMPILFIFSA